MAEPIEPVSYRPVRPLDYVSAFFAYAGMAILRILPFNWASNLGGWLARAVGPRLRKSATARRNLKAAFPDTPDAEIETIVREVWDTLGRTAFEFPLMHRLLHGADRARIEVVGQENLNPALASGKPVLFFGAHTGNWELLPIMPAYLGFRANLFYRAPNNPLMLKLFSGRTPSGELIPKGAPGAKRAFALLKKGEHLGILIDQKINDGIALPFFGRDAMTGTALAEFALRFDAPVIPLRCERLDGARFRITFEAPLELPQSGDRKADVRAVMREANATLERWIRERPGQWLWLHKRWPD